MVDHVHQLTFSKAHGWHVRCPLTLPAELSRLAKDRPKQAQHGRQDPPDDLLHGCRHVPKLDCCL